jgi:hypothetical protein
LSVGSTGQFTVTNGGAVTASTVTATALVTGSMTTAALTSGGLSLTGPLVAADIRSSGTLTAASLNSDSAIVGTLAVTTLNSGTVSTASLAIGGGTPIVNHLSQTPTIDFDSFPPNACLTQTVVVPGASDGDTVALGIPNVLGAIDGVTWFAWASAQDSVSIRGCNAMASATVDPAPAAIRIDIWKH